MNTLSVQGAALYYKATKSADIAATRKVGFAPDPPTAKHQALASDPEHANESTAQHKLHSPSESTEAEQSDDLAHGQAHTTSGGNSIPDPTRYKQEDKEDENEDGNKTITSQYTSEELDVIEQLKARDREVRAHEAAHATVGGQYAGSPSYTFQRGPDGRNYAIGGKVSIDVSTIPSDPEATARKMDIVRRAALAPAEPSAPDRRIAQEALVKKQKALTEVAKAQKEAEEENKTDETTGSDDKKSSEDSSTTQQNTGTNNSYDSTAEPSNSRSVSLQQQVEAIYSSSEPESASSTFKITV